METAQIQNGCNIFVIGRGSVGKEALVDKLVSTQFASLEGIIQIEENGKFSAHRLKFRTKFGNDIPVTLWLANTPGPIIDHWDHHNATSNNIHGVIIMFDVANRNSYSDLLNWHRDLTRAWPDNIHIVVCGNEVGNEVRKVMPKHMTFIHKKNLQYYDISTQNGSNIELPFNHIITSGFTLVPQAVENTDED